MRNARRGLTSALLIGLGLTAMINSRVESGYNLTTLVNFNGSNGSYPQSGLTVDSGGNVYGVTPFGGTNNNGTVFKIAAGSGSFSTVANFGLGVQGGTQPFGGVTLDSSGNIYGTTTGGTSYQQGAVYEIASGTSTITRLAQFTGTNQDGSYGPLAVDSRGNLFGTSGGGANNLGSLFEVVKGSNSVTTLASFTSTTGAETGGLVIDSQGNLYGTTISSVFKIASGTNTISVLASFTGYGPGQGLTLDANGNLYGTTEANGSTGINTVFEIASGSNSLTTLATLSASNIPNGTLAIDSLGDLYGTAANGFGSVGNVFELNTVGVLSTLASFNGTTGTAPAYGVVIDGQGNLYGTTTYGGTNGDGSVFELSPSITVPEPASILSMAQGVLALAGVVAYAHRRNASKVWVSPV